MSSIPENELKVVSKTLDRIVDHPNACVGYLPGRDDAALGLSVNSDLFMDTRNFFPYSLCRPRSRIGLRFWFFAIDLGQPHSNWNPAKVTRFPRS
jgi:hypothetical protein